MRAKVKVASQKIMRALLFIFSRYSYEKQRPLLRSDGIVIAAASLGAGNINAAAAIEISRFIIIIISRPISSKNQAKDASCSDMPTIKIKPALWCYQHIIITTTTAARKPLAYRILRQSFPSGKPVLPHSVDPPVTISELFSRRRPSV